MGPDTSRNGTDMTHTYEVKAEKTVEELSSSGLSESDSRRTVVSGELERWPWCRQRTLSFILSSHYRSCEATSPLRCEMRKMHDFRISVSQP